MLDQAVRVFAHLKEIRLFLRLGHRAAAVRTFAVLQLALRPEGLTGRAVPALIGALIDIALVIKFFENLLNLALMHRIRRADKSVIAGVHQVPDAVNLTRRLIDKLLRGDSSLLSFQFNLLPMLVRTGLELYIIALRPLIAGDRVRQNNLVGVADMRLSRRVRDGSCNIIRSFISHGQTSLRYYVSALFLFMVLHTADSRPSLRTARREP